ncbi:MULTISPECIES: hypothetical protein [unclassified Leifsonia]|uniref:hypothetical protein n=1 Tax=unclassified Leifsonia TaxID=2663824 RepID=UPI0006FA377F|nr:MULTISPECIES: hypothetical protein [unclassified Leifsonia]KQX07822.1 hypothetical protein ASC59_08880 [Leifsonia sp. Root1293]KRA12104.1 hypothetical protein ASD61_08880 [Leifsonia sp. Root60]
MSATTQGGYGSAAVTEPQPKPISPWLWVLIGIAAAVAGLLPWIITGMRLPLQNLWAAETLPWDMPLALLPFSQYAITTIVALLGAGAVFAGIIARATRSRQGVGGWVAILGGVLLVHTTAVVQTAAVTSNGLQARSEATLYLSLLIGVVVLAVLLGILVFWLIARAPRAGALIGLSLGALAGGSWLAELMIPVGSSYAEWQFWLAPLLRWVPAILVGVAIAWCGVDTVGRIVAVLGSLVILWVGPVLITAITSAAGSRVLASRPSEMLDYGAQVFRMALVAGEFVLVPIVVAVVIAAIGLCGRMLLQRSRSTATRPVGDTEPE